MLSYNLQNIYANRIKFVSLLQNLMGFLMEMGYVPHLELKILAKI